MSEAPSIFDSTQTDSVFEPAPVAEPQTNTSDPKAVDKNSRVLALAKTDPKGDIFAQMQANIDSVKRTVQDVGDENLREQIAAQSRLDTMNASMRLAKDPTLASESDRAAIVLGAGITAQNAVREYRGQREKYAAEQEAVKRIQDVAASGDIVQARTLLNNLQYGDANQVIRDMNTKQLIFDRELAKLQDGTKGDWFGAAAHFVLSTLPLYNSTMTGNVDIDKSLKGFGDFFWSGKRRAQESNTLWNTPVSEFSDMLQSVLPKIHDRSKFLGFQDKEKELDTLSKLSRPSSVFVQNSFDTLDNLGWIGPAEFSKAISIPGMMIRNGAKKETTNLLAQAAIDLQVGGVAEAGGVTAEEVIDHMLPDAVNPQTQIGVGSKVKIQGMGPTFDGATGTVQKAAGVDGAHYNEIILDPEHAHIVDGGFLHAKDDEIVPYATLVPQTEAASSVVSVQQGLNEILTRTSAVMEKFNELKQLGRLTDTEMQDAIDATIKKLKDEHGSNIKDVSVKSLKLSDGTSIKRVEFTLGEFETPQQAIKYAQEVGLGGDLPLEGFASNADRMIRIVPGVPTVKQPKFAEWFAKSKVTDNFKTGGKPRVMYHGTKTDFVNFTTEHGSYKDSAGQGALFFAEDPHTTKFFNYGHEHEPPAQGKTIPVYLNLENPFDPLKNPEHRATWIKYLQDNPWLSDGYEGYGPKAEGGFSKAAVDGYWGLIEKSKVQTWIKSMGHDGTYIYSESEGRNLMVYDMEKIVNAIEPSDLNGKIVRDESGSYSYRIGKVVSETGFHTEGAENKVTGMLSRMVLSARAVGNRLLANSGQAAGNTRAKLLKTFAKDYADKFRVLSSKERSNLGQVLSLGDTRGEWYNQGQLEALYERAFNRLPTPREVTAYETARTVNDIEYLLRNDEVYKQLAVTGHESVSWESGHAEGTADAVNARVVHDWKTLPTDRIYNVTDNVSYHQGHVMTAEDVARYKGEGYVLVTLDKEMKMADGTVTKAVLAKKSDLKVEPLRRDQINYRAGGHRIYEGKYFGKQARVGTQPDGEKFLANPSTFIVGKTKAEVDYWTRQMEAARILYKNGESTAVLDEVLPSYMKGEEFVKHIADGKIDADMPFRTMYDRETMPEYVNTHGYADLRNQDETEIASYLRTNGRMFYGHKGQVLPDWQGSLAPTLDPFQTINRALMNVANLSSFSDYKIQAAERWHKTFGGYLNQTGLSPMSAIRDGTFGLNVPEAIRQGGEAQRDIIKRTLGWKTEFDRQQEVYARRFSEWVGGDDPFSSRSKVASGVTQWFNTNNPVQALRGMAFDLKLGLFNVAQFPLQIGTLVAATTMSPKYGFQGMANLFPLRAYLTKSGTDHMLDTLVERGLHTQLGMEASEYKQFMKQAKESGFFDIGGTHQLIAEGGPNAAVGAFKPLDNLREAGRFFFNEGEVWNRAVAWRIAWGETREKFPELAVKSNDFQRELAGKAEEFAFSMSEQSSAAWQKGITSIPTQFWAYNARMLEAMLGKTFTNEQKVRLILGQSLLYGSAGLPLVSAVSDHFKAKNGAAPPVNSAYGLVDRGILDQAVYYMTGQDLLVSKRYGTGSFITDTIKDLFGMSAYGEKSTAEVLGGAGGSITAAGFETIWDIIKYSTYESGGTPLNELSADAWLRFAKNSSTLSNLHKAYMVNKYGTLVSNAGTTMSSDMPSQTAFAVALGISPGATDNISAHFNFKKNEKAEVDELSKYLNNQRVRAFHETDKQDEIGKEVAMRLKLTDPYIRQLALKQAQGRISPDLLNSLELQVQKDKMRAEAMNAVEGNQ